MSATIAAALFVGLNTLLIFILSLLVVTRRVAAKVDLGDGGDASLQARIRAHGNAVEYIPVTMLCLVVFAGLGASHISVLVIGGVFTAGRVLHAIGLAGGVRPARASGMILTWLGMLAAVAGLLWRVIMPG